MNKFFKSAVERFDKLKGDKTFFINPISQQDAEIYVEIRQVLKKAGLNDILVILDSYKEDKDEEIRDNLLQWNIDNPSLGLKRLIDKTAEKIVDDAEKQQFQFIKIGNLSLRSYHFLGFESFEKKDKYGIRINPTPDNAKNLPLYANYEVLYDGEEYRNTVIENIENFLAERGIDTIET